MNFKVFLKKQQYQIYQQMADYPDLLRQIQSTINQIPELYSVSFVGSNGMNMTINNQEDLQALFHLGKEYGSAALEVKDLNEDIFNMNIEEQQPKVEYKQQIQPIIQQVKYERVSCNGCGISPIIGVRYSCPQCQQFHFCLKCEEVQQHQHNLLKIKHLNQYSSKKKQIQKLANHYPSFCSMNGYQKQQKPNYSNNPYESQNCNNEDVSRSMVESISLIQELFGIEYENAVRFVKENRGLNNQQLVALAIEKRGY